MNNVVEEDAMAYQASSAEFITKTFISDEDGGYDLAVANASTNEVIDVENREFTSTKDFVVVALGLENFVSGEEIKRLRNLVVEVDRTKPNGNKSRLYIVHGFIRKEGFQTPLITFQNSGDNPQFASEQIDFSESQEMLIDSGTMDWVAKRQDADGDVIYASATETLDAGGIYLVLVSGIEDHAELGKQPSISFIEIPAF